MFFALFWQSPSFEFGYLIVEAVPDIFLQELKVHGALLISTAAEEAPLEPGAPIGVLFVDDILKGWDGIVVASSENTESLGDVGHLVGLSAIAVTQVDGRVRVAAVGMVALTM